jgi:long-subunit fatty acid transport protein
MNTSRRWGPGRDRVVARWVSPVAAAAGLAAAWLIAARSAPAFAAGIEHPDVGTISIGRGGAYAAAPSDGLAFQYNPAGFAAQTGFRVTLDSSLSWQALTFAPATGEPQVSNSAGGFLVPAGAISYGLGRVGPLSGLTLALGATGPSAIGKETYPDKGAQRYALTKSDYFIAYYSGAIAASFGNWISAGVTMQLVKGSAKFSQAVWSAPFTGTDPTGSQDSIAHIDVTSSFIPTAVFGVSARPIPRLALGLSYRPRFTFLAHGTLTTEIPDAQKIALLIGVDGDRTDFFVTFPDVIRFGAQYTFSQRLLVEVDLVAELWSHLRTIEIRPQGIFLHSDVPGLGQRVPLPDIIFEKDFQDAYSVRVGGDYVLLPGRLTVRAGYLHETSAIPLKSVSVDFGNWQRDAVSVGGSVTIARGLVASFAYAHHFMPDQHVNVPDPVENIKQVVTPCLTIGCPQPTPTGVGNGVYTGSLDVASLSLGLVLDDLRRRP